MPQDYKQSLAINLMGPYIARCKRGSGLFRGIQGLQSVSLAANQLCHLSSPKGAQPPRTIHPNEIKMLFTPKSLGLTLPLLKSGVSILVVGFLESWTSGSQPSLGAN